MAKTDCRVTLPAAILLCAVMACLNSLAGAVASLGLGLIVLACARPPMAVLASKFRAVNFFMLFIWLFVPFTMPGRAFFAIGPLQAAEPGIMLCLLVTIKANAMLAVFAGMLGCRSMADLAGALASLHCPEKLVWIFMLMERNTALIGAEWRKLTDAARLRGFRAATTVHSYKTIASMLALLLIGCHDRGQRIHDALLLRGCDGHLPFRQSGPVKKQDLVWGACALFGACLLVTINYVAPC